MAAQALENWLVSYWQSPEYGALTQAMRLREHITPPGETAMLVSLIRRLKPERVLEIGTFFAQTTLAMAEAVAAMAPGVWTRSTRSAATVSLASLRRGRKRSARSRTSSRSIR